MDDSDLIDLLGGTAAVAKRTGVRPASVSEWRGAGIPSGRRVELGASIEKVGGGKRWEQRPQDWFEIWPELIGTEGAPPAPSGTEVMAAQRAACTCGAWEMAPEEAVKAPRSPADAAPAPEPALPPAAAMLLGGRREDDHVSDFGVLEANGPKLAAEIDAVGRLVGDVPTKGQGG